jgi:dTDP-4-dehydrorhamnose reductase
MARPPILVEIFRLASAAGRKVPRINPITTAECAAAARRPHYSVLDNSKIAATFDIRLPAWQDSLASCMAQGMALAPAGSEEKEEKVA